MPGGVVPGEHEVEGREGACSGRAVKVPDISVVGVAADGWGAAWDDVVLRRDSEVCAFGPDDGATFAGLLLSGRDYEDCVMLISEQ